MTIAAERVTSAAQAEVATGGPPRTARLRDLITLEAQDLAHIPRHPLPFKGSSRTSERHDERPMLDDILHFVVGIGSLDELADFLHHAFAAFEVKTEPRSMEADVVGIVLPGCGEVSGVQGLNALPQLITSAHLLPPMTQETIPQGDHRAVNRHVKGRHDVGRPSWQLMPHIIPANPERRTPGLDLAVPFASVRRGVRSGGHVATNRQTISRFGARTCRRIAEKGGDDEDHTVGGGHDCTRCRLLEPGDCHVECRQKPTRAYAPGYL